MAETVGFIGLGVMGKPMATNLVTHGYPLIVRDVNPRPVDELVRLGAEKGASAREVAAGSSIIITMLFNDATTREVVLGQDGLMEGFRPGSVHIDMSTLLPMNAVRFAEEAEKREGHFLSAPVARGPMGAREGTLTIMAGGRKEVFERCLPLLQVMGKKIFHVGEQPEMGHVFKLTNNLLSAVHGAIAAEAMALGVKGGADPEKLYEVITEGSGNSYIFGLHVPNMLEGNKEVLTLAIKGIYKDLENVNSFAKHLRLPAPFAALGQQKYLEGIAAGKGDKDRSALVELFESLHDIAVRRDTVRGE